MSELLEKMRARAATLPSRGRARREHLLLMEDVVDEARHRIKCTGKIDYGAPSWDEWCELLRVKDEARRCGDRLAIGATLCYRPGGEGTPWLEVPKITYCCVVCRQEFRLPASVGEDYALAGRLHRVLQRLRARVPQPKHLQVGGFYR
jgi:hypothetical protein